MELEDKIELIEVRIQNFKQMIKVLKQEIVYLLAEKEQLLNPPEDNKTIGFKYGNQKKDDFNGLY